MVTGHGITALALVVPATALAVSATARADSQSFQSPSGNIFCVLDSRGAECDISDYTYQLPPRPPECGKHVAWASGFNLTLGKAAVMKCHEDTLRMPGAQTLDYGHTISAGTISCDSEPSGMTCTDSSTGHYFRVSRDSHDLG